MSIKRWAKKYLRKRGYEIIRFTPASHPLARRKQIIEYYQIDTIIDVGANYGQYAKQLRSDIGYTQKILSFEPLSNVFKSLKEAAKADSAWEVYNIAIGETNIQKEINIANNSQSSSLLNMLPSHLQAAPNSKYIGKEMIEVKTLDSLFSELCEESKNIYMKIDTQGYERQVLKGAEKSLAHIDTVQIEMSLIPLYEGELLFNEMLALMSNNGYTLIAIENGFSDPSNGQLLQVDGIFHRI